MKDDKQTNKQTGILLFVRKNRELCANEANFKNKVVKEIQV